MPEQNLLTIKTINDFAAPELDVYARLSEAQLLHCREPERGLFLAESPKVIQRALEAGCVPVSFLMEEKDEPNSEERLVLQTAEDVLIRTRNAKAAVPVYTAPAEILRNLTGFPMTRGMLSAMERPDQPSLSELCRTANRIVILEDVMNPTNVGAVFRSAAALGMDAVVLTGGCSDPLYRRASRVSMGCVFQIPWLSLPKKDGIWPNLTLSYLKSEGFQTAAMALDDESVPITDPALKNAQKLAIILGTEGEGLREETVRQCDFCVRIPMLHGVDSLNVAAASAVAFWELRHR